MSVIGSTTPRCKGVIASYPAAVLAVGFFAVTCYVLFKDVADGTPVTPDHVMSFAVLVGTFASGHLLWGQLQQWRLLPALGLTVLFAAGTFYCVTASGGRNAAAQGEKANTIHQSNEDRERIKADLKEGKERLLQAQEAEDQECASGDGTKCKGRRATRQERESYVCVLEAQLRLSDPTREENPEFRHAAKLFAAFPGVTAKEAAIFDWLVLYFPFCKALFSEIATLVFGAIGFRHPRSETAAVSIVPPKTVKLLKFKAATLSLSLKPSAIVVPFQRKQVKSLLREHALADLLTLGSVPSQETLAERWHRSEATVSRWVRQWEADGKICRSQNGRVRGIQTLP